MARVLCVDDDEEVCSRLANEFEAIGMEFHSVPRLDDLQNRIKQRFYDFVLLESSVGDKNSLEALTFLVKAAPYTKVIMMSAQGTMEMAMDAWDRGASSFISNDKDPSVIVQAVKKRYLESLGDSHLTPSNIVHSIIGESPQIKSVLSTIEQINEVDTTVLICGESGTGKELVARAIHRNSSRSKGKFAAINCGAIPENLLESELFGHKRGAFTDAKSDRKGLFETCQNGTIFLDEIGDMPISLQVKLNRVLQEKEIMPVGSSEAIKVNARVIAATNRHFQKEIQEGNFREDLYYRLAVLRMNIPSLRDRRSDIPLLVVHFLKEFNARFNKTVSAPNRELELRLSTYDWPGNVRQLRNAVERGVILAKGNQMELEEMIPVEDAPVGNHSDRGQYEQEFWWKPLSEAKHGFEKDYLCHLLEVTRGNISEMARLSGRYRADVYRLLSKYGVEWEEFRP